jgi:hypothetical protein
MVIHMKLVTGWCSPHLAVEFEKAVDKLPAGDRKDFEKEWKPVREHEAWPRWPDPEPETAANEADQRQ